MFLRVIPALAMLLLAPVAAHSHFPFVHLKGENGQSVLHVYFAETAEPDDPALLDRLLDSKAWHLEAGGSPMPLSLTKGTDSLVAETSNSDSAVYGLTKDYGVISRGESTFRLAYYAKTFSGREAWPVNASKHLALDIVPQRQGDKLILTVLWHGKPLPNAEVVVEGGIESLEGKTDAEGKFACALPDPELYSIRAKHVVEKSGDVDGKHFDSTRHYSTLTLDLQ